MVVGFMVLIYLMMGCVLESLSMILLTVPFFYPVLQQLDLGRNAQQSGRSANLVRDPCGRRDPNQLDHTSFGNERLRDALGHTRHRALDRVPWRALVLAG